MAKPKKAYYIEQTGAKLRYGQKGGGMLSRLPSAQERAQTMLHQGAEGVKLYEAELVWKEIDLDA